MARVLSRTLTIARFPSESILTHTTTTKLSLSLSPVSRSIAAVARGYRSTHTPKAQLIELDLDSSSCDGGDVEVLGLKKLEDAIHSIVVQRSAPAWLPFRPGSSYWVPPKPHAGNIVELVGKLTNPLSEDETRAFTSVRGWPSSSYFLKGDAFPHPLPVEVEVKVHVQSKADKTSKSEDEE